MWGTLEQRRAIEIDVRFIPTHVGNTSPPPCCQSPGTVYPHACGEHFIYSACCAVPCGLSPRMWGTREVAPRHDHTLRFIPTYVGNASAFCNLSSKVPVYPHVCGERARCEPQSNGFCGLSPRMWGTPVIEHCPLEISRFIPTYVGNAFSRNSCTSSSAVYPHVCGERQHCVNQIPHGGGLSPRMWGTRCIYSNGRSICRFIPTYVGNVAAQPSGFAGMTVYPHVCGERSKRTLLNLKNFITGKNSTDLY